MEKPVIVRMVNRTFQFGDFMSLQMSLRSLDNRILPPDKNFLLPKLLKKLPYFDRQHFDITDIRK